MTIADPRNLNERYNELFRERDLDDLLALYEDDAILCPVPGQQVQGHIEDRKAPGWFDRAERSPHCVGAKLCRIRELRFAPGALAIRRNIPGWQTC
jgi:ketosteroid isomerase-like protein